MRDDIVYYRGNDAQGKTEGGFYPIMMGVGDTIQKSFTEITKRLGDGFDNIRETVLNEKFENLRMAYIPNVRDDKTKGTKAVEYHVASDPARVGEPLFKRRNPFHALKIFLKPYLFNFYIVEHNTVKHHNMSTHIIQAYDETFVEYMANHYRGIYCKRQIFENVANVLRWIVNLGIFDPLDRSRLDFRDPKLDLKENKTLYYIYVVDHIWLSVFELTHYIVISNGFMIQAVATVRHWVHSSTDQDMDDEKNDLLNIDISALLVKLYATSFVYYQNMSENIVDSIIYALGGKFAEFITGTGFSFRTFWESLFAAWNASFWYALGPPMLDLVKKIRMDPTMDRFDLAWKLGKSSYWSGTPTSRVNTNNSCTGVGDGKKPQDDVTTDE